MIESQHREVKVRVRHKCRGPVKRRWERPIPVVEDIVVNVSALHKVEPSEWSNQLEEVIGRLGIICSICGESSRVDSPVVELGIYADQNDRVGQTKLVNSYNLDELFT